MHTCVHVTEDQSDVALVPDQVAIEDKSRARIIHADDTSLLGDYVGACSFLSIVFAADTRITPIHPT